MGTKRNIDVKKVLLSNFFTLFVVLILVLLVFGNMNPNYFSWANAINILYAAVTVGLLAIGETYLIIAGHLDLGSGSVGALSGVLVAILIKAGVPWGLAIVGVLIMALVVALLNSLLVNVFKLQPFIATLATSSACEGVGYIICNGRSVSIASKTFISIGTGRVLGIPIPIIIMVILFLIFGFVLARTRFGRSIYMIGGNATAARLAGLNPKRISTILYIISSTIAALAGIILAARMHTGAPTAVHGEEFNAITAAVLGGIAFSGGTGTLGGCFIGLIVLNCFNNGLTVVNVSSFWQLVARGLLLMAALVLDYFRTTRTNKMLR